jgi:hypothetical protein
MSHATDAHKNKPHGTGRQLTGIEQSILSGKPQKLEMNSHAENPSHTPIKVHPVPRPQ